MTARRQNIISAIVVANLIWIGAMVTAHEIVLAGKPLPLNAGVDRASATVDPREIRLRDVWDRGTARIAIPQTTYFRTGLEIPVAQWSDQPRLGATRVSIHLAQVPLDQAMAAITAQSRVRLDVSPTNLLTRPMAVRPVVTLDGDSIPLSEAVLTLCTQSNLNMLTEEPSGGARTAAPVDGSPRILLGQGAADRRPGIWSVAGAFAFDLVRIDQTGALRPDGTADDSISLSINLHAEPKVMVLATPTKIDVTEMVDERGVSLLKSPASANQAGNWRRNLQVTLPADHGRWIRRLAADTTWTVGTATAPISVPDAVKAAGSTFSNGGIDALIQSVTRPTEPTQLNTQLTVVVVYSQKAGATLDWPTLSPLLRRGHVWIDGWGVPTSIQAQADAKAKPPVMKITYQWTNMQRGAPGPLRIDVPLGADKIHVPMEFRDVPLP